MSATLALLSHIFLEDLSAFRIVAVQSIQNGVDVWWPISREIEGDAHVCGSGRKNSGRET